MRSGFRKLGVTLLFLFFTLMAGVVSDGCVVDAAPFWLKKGSYAYYELKADIIHFGNTTDIRPANGTYGWKCLEVAGRSATLEVVINVSGLALMDADEHGIRKWGEWRFEETYEVAVDVETREMYVEDEYIGISLYWMPTDVEGLESIGNFTSYGNLTLSATVYGVGPSVETPYRTFAGDELWLVLSEDVSIPGGIIGDGLFYEKESGLLVSGFFVDNVWSQKIAAEYILGSHEEKNTDPFKLKETNVWFSPEPPSLLELLLPYIAAAVVAATVVGIALVYVTKIRKKTSKH